MSASEKLKALEAIRADSGYSEARHAGSDILDALPQIVAVVDTSICHRFTTSPCDTRPEINPFDYCPRCVALAALDEALPSTYEKSYMGGVS